MSENTENKSIPEQVAPVPATGVTPASVPPNGGVSAPAESPAAKQDAKITAAFIKQRQELRELKAKLAAAPANTPSPATPVTEQPKPVSEVPPQAPAPITAVSGAAELEKQAIKALSEDKDIMAVPGAVMDILSMIDDDPNLSKLNDAFPSLAIQEAKKMYMAKAGISSAPVVPMNPTPSGGMSGGNVDLEALLAQCEAATPGTRAHAELVSKVNAEMKKRGML